MSKWVAYIYDGITGFASIAVLLVVAVAIHVIHNVTVAVAAAGVVILAIAGLRAAFRRQWAPGASLAAALGAAAPVAVIGVWFLHAAGMRAFWIVLAAVFFTTGAASLMAGSIRKRRPVVAFALFICFLSTLAFSIHGVHALADGVDSAALIEEPAPATSIRYEDGTALTNAGFAGHVTVIDFWGTWCVACLAEMPAMEEVYQRYQQSRDVRFVAVNPGWAGDDDSQRVFAFARRRRLLLPMATAPPEAVHQYGGVALPLTIVIDQQGRIRLRSTGFRNNKALISELINTIEQLRAAGH